MSSRRHIHSRGGISWLALAIGIVAGLAAGLFYTWEVDPVIERNTAPWQLSASAREDYIVAVALSYAQNRDLGLAFNRLRAVSPDQNVWNVVADVACTRVKTGKTVTNSDIRVIRALEQLYLSQGASGCADGLYPTPAPMAFATPVPTLSPTATFPPPPTKTPTVPVPTPQPVQSPRPTTTPRRGDYVLGRLQSFCDPLASGILEIRVFDQRGEGIPGVPVTVTWGGDETDTFFTGLKPERDEGYADFAMEPGRTYTVSIPNLDSASPVVEADLCEAELDGETVPSVTSYAISFQQRAN